MIQGPLDGRHAHGERAVGIPGSRVTICCVGWTLGTGMLLGVKTVRPDVWLSILPMQVVQPLHTLGAIGLLVAGIATLAAMVVRRVGGCAGPLPVLILPGMGVFMLLGAAGIVSGNGSGLEYMSWPPVLTALPLVLLVSVACVTAVNLRKLVRLSPEGAWLLMMGTCLAVLGMIERALGLGETGPVRALMIEWHALDTSFAGFNTALYGLSILIRVEPGSGRPLRGRWMYSLAVIALLSTFGHHHYASSQPMPLKWIALAASLLGIVSFARHVLMIRRSFGSRPRSEVTLDISAGLWTAFAVGSGVVLAIPPVNHVLHGTHAIVGHSMGAIIGVDVLIILAAMLAGRLDEQGERASRRAIRVVNIALALLVLDLVCAGVCKGLLRTEGTHREYQSLVRGVLLPLPLVGAVLSIAIGRLCVLAWQMPRQRCIQPE